MRPLVADNLSDNAKRPFQAKFLPSNCAAVPCSV